MFSTSRTAALAASAAMLTALSGCALVTPVSNEDPPSPVAQCVQGHTWSLDTADLGAQLLAEVQRDHPEVTGLEVSGAKTIEWTADDSVTMESDLSIRITAPAGDQELVITQTQTGTGSGKAYVDADVAIPRRWKNEIEVQTVAEQGGAPLEAAPWGPPRSDFDDTTGWVLTCDGAAMTLQPRGTDLVQKWTAG
ncbi:MAG TPA: hypothetical protein VN200_05155 [Rhodoglobus sp.]|nr:hypothetical protein [Rhodoglobus sp.]